MKSNILEITTGNFISEIFLIFYWLGRPIIAYCETNCRFFGVPDWLNNMHAFLCVLCFFLSGFEVPSEHKSSPEIALPPLSKLSAHVNPHRPHTQDYGSPFLSRPSLSLNLSSPVAYTSPSSLRPRFDLVIMFHPPQAEAFTPRITLTVCSY